MEPKSPGSIIRDFFKRVASRARQYQVEALNDESDPRYWAGRRDAAVELLEDVTNLQGDLVAAAAMQGEVIKAQERLIAMLKHDSNLPDI